MSRTQNLGLPLIAPSQAQKHVTVNEALVRIDAVSQLAVEASDGVAPPGEALEGRAYLVSGDPIGDWSGQGGKVAVKSNGGWVFIEPQAGWSAWDKGRSQLLQYDGSEWIGDAVAISPGGAATRHQVLEIDHAIGLGATSVATGAIPANSLVLGVTGRVLEAIEGPGVYTWRLGVAGSENRYGSGLGSAAGSFVHGLTSSPLAYYSDTDLVFSAEQGSFSGGTVRLSLHVVVLGLPRAA